MKTDDHSPNPALHDREGVATYSRIASSDQADPMIQNDIQECQAFVEEAGWKVATAFSDGPVSGLNMVDRPGLAAMMAAAARGEFKIVVMRDIDRISRQPGVAQDYIGKLEELGVAVWLTTTRGQVNELELAFRRVAENNYSKSMSRRIKAGMANAKARREAEKQAALPARGARARGYGCVQESSGHKAGWADRERKCKAYAEENGWIWCGFHVGAFDTAAPPTQTVLPTPGVVEAAVRGEYDVLVVADLADLGHRSSGLLRVVQDLMDVGVTTCLVDQGVIVEIDPFRTIFEGLKALDRKLLAGVARE